MTNAVAAPSARVVSSEISLTVCPESNCNVPVSCIFPVDVMFPALMSACPETFILPDTIPVSVVVIKLKIPPEVPESLSSHIRATFESQPLSITHPASLAFAPVTAVFSAMIGSSVAILTVSVKFP